MGLWCGAVAAAVAWLLFRGAPEPESGWGFQWGTLELPAILVALVLGFVTGARAQQRGAAAVRAHLDAVQAAAKAGAEQALSEGVKVDVSVGGAQ